MSTRTRSVTIRLTDPEYQQINGEAQVAGSGFSDYARRKLLAPNASQLAERVRRNQTVLDELENAVATARRVLEGE